MVEPKMEKRKVLIVEGHPIICRGFSLLINQEPDLVAVGEARNGLEALEVCRLSIPDVLVTDISMSGVNGLDLIKRMKQSYPQTPCIALSVHDDAIQAKGAFRAGAKGYLEKAEAWENILEALRVVLTGKIFLSEKLAGVLLQSEVIGKDDLDPLSRLSDRETEVFHLLGQGMPPRAISTYLSLSIKTIETHFAHLKQKLRLKNAEELLRFAVQNGAGELSHLSQSNLHISHNSPVHI